MAIQEITAAIGAIKAGMDMARLLKDADKAFAVAELKLKSVDLLSALADARTSLMDAQETANGLQAEIDRLNDALRTKDDVARVGNAYYPKSDDGDGHGHPYCMRCWEIDHRLVHLSLPRFNNEPGTCPSCKAQFFARARG